MTVEAELVRRRNLGEAVVLATVIRVDGKPPSRPGEKILLGRDEAIAGTLGCSEFDSAARADAAGILDSGQPGLRTYRHDLGVIEVYLEPYGAEPALLVLGETPVGGLLREWAARAGFRVAGTPEIGRGELYVVATDHDDAGLADQLEAALRAKPRFIGVMGSRRHTGHHLDELRRRGADEKAVAAIQSPVGLDIGARTAEEIALSILAGLVAVRRGARGGWKALR
ncbi:MAG: XdhC family protein [Candidatus Dormibacteraceae bacterium]